jgi:hypothetical protein
MQLGISLAFIANARLTDIVGLIQPRDQTVNVAEYGAAGTPACPLINAAIRYAVPAPVPRRTEAMSKR